MQLRFDFMRDAAGPGDGLRRMPGAAHGGGNDNIRLFERQRRRDGLRLAPAPLAQIDVGFVPMKHRRIGRFRMTKEKYPRGHRTSPTPSYEDRTTSIKRRI